MPRGVTRGLQYSISDQCAARPTELGTHCSRAGMHVQVQSIVLGVIIFAAIQQVVMYNLYYKYDALSALSTSLLRSRYHGSDQIRR